jgi:N-hydroxyarylamine O-acetyltransferase
MTSEIDINSYFSRIGYQGSQSATLQTLRELHALHPSAITFENLDVLLQRPIRLELDAIMQKLVTLGRGGYCYEQNTLFLAALRTLGFEVRAVAARVQWNAGGLVAARSHMALLLRQPDGHYIADVGFGGLTLTAPLLFEPDIEQQTAHGLYRLVRIGDEYQVQARIEATWSAMYQFSLAEQAPADWEMANWFMSTCPDSIFTSTLIAARPHGDARYTLRNNRLRIHRPDGASEQRQIATFSELCGVLRRDFAINLAPADEHALAQFMAKTLTAP